VATTARPWILALLLLAGCGDGSEGGDPGTPPPSSSLTATNALFDENQVNDIHLTIDPADWASIVADDRGDAYRRASLRWKDVVVNDIAVRPSGHATRFPGNQKMSLKLDFNEFVQGQKFLGLKSLKLDGVIEGTMMRERISYGVYRALVPAAPRAVHCRFHVNGEYRGVYLIEERVTDDLLEHRFGNDDGLLYRVLVSVPEAFAWRGTDPGAYVGERPYDCEHPDDADNPDHSPLVRFLDVLNHRPAELGTVVDLENLIRSLALDVALVARDGLLRDDGPPQNYYTVWRPQTGLFQFMPWDVDQTLTTDRTGLSMYYNFEKTRIATVVRQTPELDARFRAMVGQIIATLTHPDILSARIDEVWTQIREHVYADPYKKSSNATMDGMPDYLKRVARQRYDSLKAELGLP
jgi:spore coat protein CotH